MAKRGDAVSRSEVTERVARHREGMEGIGKELEQIVADIETIRKTLEELDQGGTSDAAEEVERAIEGAEDVTVGEFSQESGQLEEVQKDSEEHEAELKERSDSASADLGRISEASGRITRDVTNNAFIPAKEAALLDIDFFAEQGKRAQEAREECRRLHEDHERRVNDKRRT